jgi:hypothetical protein
VPLNEVGCGVLVPAAYGREKSVRHPPQNDKFAHG